MTSEGPGVSRQSLKDAEKVLGSMVDIGERYDDKDPAWAIAARQAVREKLREGNDG